MHGTMYCNAKKHLWCRYHHTPYILLVHPWKALMSLGILIRKLYAYISYFLHILSAIAINHEFKSPLVYNCCVVHIWPAAFADYGCIPYCLVSKNYQYYKHRSSWHYNMPFVYLCWHLTQCKKWSGWCTSPFSIQSSKYRPRASKILYCWIPQWNMRWQHSFIVCVIDCAVNLESGENLNRVNNDRVTYNQWVIYLFVIDCAPKGRSSGLGSWFL